MNGPPKKLKRKHKIVSYFTQHEKFDLEKFIKENNVSSTSELIRTSINFYRRFWDQGFTIISKKEAIRNKTWDGWEQQKSRKEIGEKLQISGMGLVVNELKNRFKANRESNTKLLSPVPPDKIKHIYNICVKKLE
jgi:enolase